METTRVECIQPASLRHPATFPTLQRAISLQEAVTVTSWTVCVYMCWCTTKQRGIISPACHKPECFRTAAAVSNSMFWPPSNDQMPAFLLFIDLTDYNSWQNRRANVCLYLLYLLSAFKHLHWNTYVQALFQQCLRQKCSKQAAQTTSR